MNQRKNHNQRLVPRVTTTRREQTRNFRQTPFEIDPALSQASASAESPCVPMRLSTGSRPKGPKYLLRWVPVPSESPAQNHRRNFENIYSWRLPMRPRDSREGDRCALLPKPHTYSSRRTY